MSGYHIAFSPLLGFWPLVGLASLVGVAVLALAVLRPRGALLRALALGLLLLALANPSFTHEDREALSNVLAVVVDRSASQSVDDRDVRTQEALARIEERAAALANTEVRIIESETAGSDGTELFKALQAGLADVPSDRVAGAILITDGVVHDVPANPAQLGFNAPVHGLVTGRPNERDRRIVLTTTPRFGIVDRTQIVGFRVEDIGIEAQASASVTVRRNGEEIARTIVLPGRDSEVEIPIAHAGPNVVELQVDEVPDELTAINNRVALSIEGVREKLRVLLVSGEPHSGERTWRNLLKSDANVDLVHFTILRPPEKQDGTPINELSLIAFPTRELFVTKIEEFDLIIFDRYARHGILPLLYFDNIAQYVRRGGAVLVAAGPDYASSGSLAETPLGAVLPAAPLGGVIERAYKPMITEAGNRHPVTRRLPGSGPEPDWSEWFRIVETRTLNDHKPLMSGPNDNPLLVLSREDEGRVALLLSDHVWLWARGYEGGGPHQDLLRRTVHWLMKEPDLDEEALRMSARGGMLTIERQTMSDSAAPITLTDPAGQTRMVELAETEPGLFRANIQSDLQGLYRAEDGEFTALANLGPANPREFQEIASTTERLATIAGPTGGSVRRIANAEGELDVPRLLQARAGSRAYGADWIGVRESQASVVRGLTMFPIFAGLLGLALLFASLSAAWAREGR